MREGKKEVGKRRQEGERNKKEKNTFNHLNIHQKETCQVNLSVSIGSVKKERKIRMFFRQQCGKITKTLKSKLQKQ